MHKILALLTFESIALIGSLFLLAYVKKNDIGKWLQYGAAAISIFIMVIMIGSVFTCCMPCYKGLGGGHCGPKGEQSCPMGSGQGGCMMMGNDKCNSNESCPMKGGMNEQCSSKGGMNEDCCSKGNMDMDHCQMGEDKNVEIEINDNGDTIKKKVTIKKSH